MADPREPYGRIFHEQGRLTVNAEREKPFGVGPWQERTVEQQEIDMRGASAVAAQAIRDAGLENERMRMQLFAIGTALPAARRALTIAITGTEYEAEAKPFRRALEIFGGEAGPADPETLAALGGQERGGEDEPASPVAAALDGPEVPGQLPLPGTEPA